VELAMADLQALKVYADSSKQEFVLRFLGSKQQQQPPQSEQQSAKPKPVFKKQLKPKPKPKPDEQQKQQQALQAPAFPPHSYPPGSSLYTQDWIFIAQKKARF
jgi:outer membrane biosynthesis protein TonB